MDFRLVGIGEVLWDLLPGGRQLGGAPANFAYHAAALGAQAGLISRVGADELGRALIHRLEKLGVPTTHIQSNDSAPTGTVTVHVSADGQPQFTIHEGVAWDRIAVEPAAQAAVLEADAVCFGTLAQRLEPSRGTVRTLVSATRPDALRILDVNLRQHYYSSAVIEESLVLANVLKVNEGELPRLALMFGLAGGERDQISSLTERFRLRLVAFTRGQHGSVLFAAGRWSDHPGMAVKVADTVGAGDAFTAAMTLGFLAGWDLDTINRRANEVAAYVASCHGATPELPETLRGLFR
jgi:fructokinase